MQINPANVISLIRPIIAFIGIVIAIEIQGVFGYIIGTSLLALAVFLDAVDGRIARACGHQSKIGALTDVCADHMVANMVWVGLMKLGQVEYWVPILTSSRDLLVDLARQVGEYQTGLNGFEQLRGKSYGWLVYSRSMRFGYGAAKLSAWCVLLLAPLFPFLRPAGQPLVVICVGLCIIRALPYIFANWRPMILVGPVVR